MQDNFNYTMNKAIRQLQELSKLGKSLRLAAEWSKPWQCLISTMLSARTRDEVTIVVCNKLFKKYKTIQKLSKTKLTDLQKMIRPVNFYKTKAKNVIACAKMSNKEYHGKVPLDFDKLMKLPGVGRKTANVFLNEIGKQTIGVDTHLSYISQKLGWTKNKNPHKIEDDLKKLFPKKSWKRINPVAVRFGKTYTSRKRKDELLKRIRNIK